MSGSNHRFLKISTSSSFQPGVHDTLFHVRYHAPLGGDMHQVQLRIQVDCDGDGELSVREWGRYLAQEEKRFGVEITGPMSWDTVSPQTEGFDDLAVHSMTYSTSKQSQVFHELRKWPSDTWISIKCQYPRSGKIDLDILFGTEYADLPLPNDDVKEPPESEEPVDWDKLDLPPSRRQIINGWAMTSSEYDDCNSGRS